MSLDLNRQVMEQEQLFLGKNVTVIVQNKMGEDLGAKSISKNMGETLIQEDYVPRQMGADTVQVLVFYYSLRM